jgi:hypothetical protein
MAGRWNQDRRREWEDRVWRQRQSGMSVAEFCASEGVSTSSFYHWRNVFRQQADRARNAAKQIGGEHAGKQRQDRKQSNDGRHPSFVPVTVIDPSPAGRAIEIELPNGAVVRLPADADAELVCRLVGAAGVLRGTDEGAGRC